MCSELPGQSQAVADRLVAAAADRWVADCELVCSELPGQCQAAADRRVAD